MKKKIKDGNTKVLNIIKEKKSPNKKKINKLLITNNSAYLKPVEKNDNIW